VFSKIKTIHQVSHDDPAMSRGLVSAIKSPQKKNGDFHGAGD